MNNGKEYNKFKQWMVDNNYTARQVAEAVGCKPKSIYAYMQGYRQPNRKTMKKMDLALGIKSKDMFD